MTRPTTAVDAIANEFVKTEARLSPVFATYAGLPGDDGAYPDYSPEGLAEYAAEMRKVLADLDSAPIEDDVDRITVAAMHERLGLNLETYDSGWLHADLNVIASPAQELREIFDLMPTDTATAWENIARRMRALPSAAEGYIAALQHAASDGKIASTRQYTEVIKQTEELAGESSFFDDLAAQGSTAASLPDELLSELKQAATVAKEGYALLTSALKELAARAPQGDAVGRDRYELASREFLGAQVDLDETYEWGIEELGRIIDEQREVATQIGGPGTSVAQAIELLNNDPARILHGTKALQEWMQITSDEALHALKDVHFDIPEPVQRLECMIAPTQSGGIYYTGPSADFSRPGRMWWAVPEGETEFATWQERTTVYHEGVPGHHLQIGQTMYRSELLNDWRRISSWVSGHGEGWALYAERLMADLGFLDDPGDRMGMLDAQRLRAARVVLDIGVHLGKQFPREFEDQLSQAPTGTWNAVNAWEFLRANAAVGEGFLRFELNRYLGWPGQAPSYKVGQRLWEQLRDQTKLREGTDFDLKAFHRRALDVGSVGLDTLRLALLGV